MIALAQKCSTHLSFGATGAVVLKGFNRERFNNNSSEEQDATLRLFYFLLSCYISGGNNVSSQGSGGLVTKRGRLYDVVDRGLDIHQEDVLFSATNAASSFHTDSTDRFCFPDVVGLLCLHQVSRGDQGHLSLVNAANAYEYLRKNAPAFVLQELQQPLIRDVLDRGLGGNAAPKELARVENNQFPVFSQQLGGEGLHHPVGRWTFRYMRFWIEKGLEKTGRRMTPELHAALDLLDSTLETKVPKIRVRMERGDMVFCNNHFVAHHRDVYKDVVGERKRHMVRVWLNLPSDC